MTKADDYIPELLADSDLVLSPAVIGHNIDYTPNYVTARLGKLKDAGLVERVDTGMYEITDRGRTYLSMVNSTRTSWRMGWVNEVPRASGIEHASKPP